MDTMKAKLLKIVAMAIGNALEEGEIVAAKGFEALVLQYTVRALPEVTAEDVRELMDRPLQDIFPVYDLPLVEEDDE